METLNTVTEVSLYTAFTSDTKMVADQIERRGTKIIAIALGEDCYPYLKQIYTNTILCDDLTKLPDQMIDSEEMYVLSNFNI